MRPVPACRSESRAQEIAYKSFCRELYSMGASREPERGGGRDCRTIDRDSDRRGIQFDETPREARVLESQCSVARLKRTQPAVEVENLEWRWRRSGRQNMRAGGDPRIASGGEGPRLAVEAGRTIPRDSGSSRA